MVERQTIGGCRISTLGFNFMNDAEFFLSKLRNSIEGPMVFVSAEPKSNCISLQLWPVHRQPCLRAGKLLHDIARNLFNIALLRQSRNESVENLFATFATMTTTVHNLQNLKDFVQGSVFVPPTTAASAIAHVAHNTLASTDVSTEHVNLAKLALLELCRNPQFDTIPHLLTICENDFSIYNINAFLIASTAWKALTAACVNITDPAQMPCSQRFRILDSALNGAAKILVDILASDSRQREGVDGLAQVTRSLKVARFHCINAARCSKAFASLDKSGEECDDQIVTVLSTALYLTALTSLTCSFDASVPQSIRQFLIESIAPALGAASRSVLAMVAAVCKGESQRNGGCIVSTALANIVKENGLTNLATKELTNHALQIVAVLYLMHYSVSINSDNNLEREGALNVSTSNRGGNVLCRSVFAPVLLPTLFAAVECSYAAVVTLREIESGCMFLDCISECIEKCLGRFHVERYVCSGNGLQDSLFVEVSASNPARSLLAQRGIIQLMSGHQDVIRRKNLLLRVLHCARVSLSLCTGHFTGRWIPLASALAVLSMRRGDHLGDVLREYLGDLEKVSSRRLQSDTSAIDDPILLRLLAMMCEFALRRRDIQQDGGVSKDEEESSDPVQEVILSLGAHRAKLGSFVKGLLLGNSSACLADGALCALPYLLDEQSTLSTALACLKRKGWTIEVYQRILNMLDPGLMSSSAMRLACARMSDLIQTFGISMCAPVSAFIARAAIYLHQSVSLNDWQMLSRLLELAFSTLRKAAPTNDVRHALCRATVFYHAANALKVTNRISRASPGRQTQAAIPNSVLVVIEEAQEKIQLMSDASNSCNSIRTLAEDYGTIAREIAYAKEHAEMESSVVESELNEIVRAKNQLIDATKKALKTVGSGSWSKGELRMRISEVKDLVSVFEKITQEHVEHDQDKVATRVNGSEP